MKKIIVIANAALMVLVLSGCGNANIKLVKNGCLRRYPDVTIEGGYDYALKSPKWNTLTTAKKQRVVEVRGEVKDDKLRKYILDSFYNSENAFTDEEKLFWSRYGFMNSVLFESITYFIEEQKPSNLDGYVRLNLRDINRGYHDDLVAYNNFRGFAEEGLREVFAFLHMDKTGDLPELMKRLKTVEKQAPSFDSDPTGNAAGGYEYYLDRKKEMDSYAQKAKEAEEFIAKTQRQFEKDHEKAHDARLKFVKSFWNKSDPIIIAQFIINVDGKSFSSGAVIATLDGGPWDGKELSIDTSEWEEQVFSN